MPTHEKNKMIQVGIITSAHGVQGEMKLRSFTADPLSIFDYQPLHDASGQQHYSFTVRSEVKGQFIVRLKGISDRNAAEKMAHTALYVPRERLPEPEDEETLYIEDLRGLRVLLEDGTLYGQVQDVVNFGAGDIVEIKPAQGGKSELYPFTHATFPTIDLTSGHLVVCTPQVVMAPPKGKDEA